MSTILVLFLTGLTAYSAPTGNAKQNLSKDINFEDMLIHGKYHFSDEVVVTVEQDKVINGLLHVRKDFKDRLKRSKYTIR